MDDYFGHPDSLIAKNNIKITNCYLCYVLGSYKDSCVLQTKTTYDNLGRLISVRNGENISGGLTSLRSDYTYKPNDILIVNKKFLLNDFCFQNYRYLYTFDAQGLTNGTKYEKTNTNEIELRIEYQKRKNGDIFKKKYDYLGRLIDTTTLTVYDENTVELPDDSSTTIFSKKRLFRYNDRIHGKVNVQQTVGTNGKLIERLFFTVDSSKNVLNYDSKYIYLYDLQDRLIREILVGNNNNDFGREKRYSYNEMGIIISFVEDSPDFKTETLYDDLGRTITITQTISGHISATKFTYDAVTGLCIKQENSTGNELKNYKKFEYLNN